MRRSHALAAAVVAVALIAAIDARLVLPTATALTCGALAAPQRWLPRLGPRIALAAGAWLVAARLGLGPPDPSTPIPGRQEATESAWAATVETVTRRAGGRQIAILDIDSSGRVYAQLPRYPEVTPGDVVTVEGRFEPLPAVPPPEDEGWVGYLRRIGVAGTLEGRSMRQETRGAEPPARLAQLRGAAGDVIGAALPEPQAGLAGAILLGLRERVDPQLARDFTKAGLSHVVAISGAHLAVIAGLVGALGRPLSRGRRSLLIGSVVGTYALLVGASPSVARAALMTSIALLAREGGRRAGGSRALALAVAAMLIVEPRSIVDPGLQLSAFATAGIVGWAAPLSARIERAMPLVPPTLRETLAVSLSAQVATLPVVLFDFGRLSLVAPLANLVAVPLVPIVMAGAALALPLGILLLAGMPPLLGSVALVCAALPVSAFVAIARLAAAVPFASVELPDRFATPMALLAGMVVVLIAKAGPRTARWRASG